MAFTICKLIENLAPRHDISLVSFVRSEEEKQQVKQLLPYCRRVETVLIPQGIGRKLWTRTKMLTLTPLAFSQGYCAEMRDKIRSMTAEQKYDVVQMDYTMGQYVSEISGSATVIYLLDLIYEKARTLSSHLPFSRKKLEWLADSFLCRRYERKLYTQFDLVLAISEKIKQSLLACNPALDISVLPTGVDIPRAPKRSHDAKGRNIVFMGAMWRPENVDAVTYFYRSVFGRIRDAIPDVTLHIVGGSPAEEIKQLASDPSVHVTGYVEDLPSFYTQCDVSIAPIRMAGGVHCKILDAMASGLPVITTTGGNEGIGAIPDKEIIIADDAGTFARRTIELLEDEALRNTIGTAGLVFVQRNFGWKPIIARLEASYQRCLSSRV